MNHSSSTSASSIEWQTDSLNEQVIRNELFSKRLKHFKETKDKHSLLVISDYDYTITKKKNQEESLHCTYHFFDKSPVMPDDFKKASRALFHKYDKYDNDPSLSIEVRTKNLEVYYKDDLTLMADLHLTKEQMNDNFEAVYKEGRFFFRKGAKAFFDLLKLNHIPLLYISGGIKEVILANLLKLLGGDYNTDGRIDVISNEFTYDNITEKTNGVREPIIHALNKSEFIDKVLVNKYDLAKTNILFLGDNINDIDCLANLDCPNLLSVAFSNGTTIFDDYYKKYDMIIANDGDFTQVNNLIKQLI